MTETMDIFRTLCKAHGTKEAGYETTKSVETRLQKAFSSRNLRFMPCGTDTAVPRATSKGAEIALPIGSLHLRT